MKLVLTSDWHLSLARPPMRMEDDWLAAQRSALDAALRAARAHDAPVLVAGDLFDSPVAHPSVVNLALEFIAAAGRVLCVAGNHDLPYHQAALMDKSSYGVVERFLPACVSGGGRRLAVERVHYGEKAAGGACDVLMAHMFAVRTDRDRPPGRECATGPGLLEMFPRARVVVVGDNHDPWTYRSGGRLVVNCGCLMRRSASEARYPAGFWVVDTDSLEAERVLADEGAQVDAGYLEAAAESADAGAASYAELVEELRSGVERSYDFASALDAYVRDNGSRLGAAVRQILEDTSDFVKTNGGKEF